MGIDVIFLIAILILSVVIHEVSHGVVANWLGDPTARMEGRLTLNPIKHIDPMGSVILPAILVLSGTGFVFGWAKPVPYNPYNLHRGGRWAEALVAVAGPTSNLIIALIFGIIVRLGVLPANTIGLVASIVFLNVLLAVFNMIPIPPLDGSKVIVPFLPQTLLIQYNKLRVLLERNMFIGFGIVFVVVLLFAAPFTMWVNTLTRVIIGM